MTAYVTTILSISIVLMAATFVGTITFVVMYRPFSPRLHGVHGRHLLYTTYSLAALYGGSLFNLVLPIPLGLGYAVQAVILAALCAVVWQRVVLLRREQLEYRKSHPEGRDSP